MKFSKEHERLARAAMEQANREIERDHQNGIFDEGDPNHPMYNNGLNYTKLFGHSYTSIMGKQYK